MDRENDLCKAMKFSLHSSGDLIHLRLRLEEDILQMLNEPTIPQFVSETMRSIPTKSAKPAMPSEIILMNKLVLQYLKHAGLSQTAAVLISECGLPQNYVHDALLQSRVTSVENAKDKPLLSNMTSSYVASKVRKEETTLSNLKQVDSEKGKD